MKYLISFILLVFVAFNAKAEKFHDLTFTQFKVLKPTLELDTKIFTGMLNESAIMEMYLDKDQSFVLIVHSVSDLSCIYFMGTMGTLEGFRS